MVLLTTEQEKELVNRFANCIATRRKLKVTGWIIEVDGLILKPYASSWKACWTTHKGALKALTRHCLFRRDYIPWLVSDITTNPINYTQEGKLMIDYTIEKLIGLLLESGKLVIKEVKDHEVEFGV